MITRPRPVYHTPCAAQVNTERYRPPRVPIGPDSRAVILNIDRGMNVGFKTQSDLQFTLKIDAKYDGCIELTPTIEITSFAYESHQAYFNVVDITTSIKLPGLYRANIFLGDVCIGQVELVLAPAFAVNGGRKKESECAEGNWKEPEYPVPIPCTPPQCGTCIETSCNISGCDNQVDHSGYGSNVFVRKGYGS